MTGIDLDKLTSMNKCNYKKIRQLIFHHMPQIAGFLAMVNSLTPEDEAV
jgi:hypothetical protein